MRTIIQTALIPLVNLDQVSRQRANPQHLAYSAAIPLKVKTQSYETQLDLLSHPVL
jgi:hypothetical protein